MKDEVKALWRLCFNDSDEFVDLYFEKRYREVDCMVVRCGGEIVSALQMIHYPMTFCGSIISTSYVSGACTHPDYRKQGLMRQLLAETHRRMYQENMLLGMLIPANKELHAYYAESGYAPVFGYANLRVLAEELYFSPLYTVFDETEDRAFLCEHYRYFSACIKRRSCCVLHTKEDFLMIMADLRLSNGKLLVARRGGLVNGMAFCFKEGNRLVIKELLADNEGIKESLQKKACELFEMEEVVCVVPSSADSLYLGMARVIHAEKMMALVARKYPQIEMFIQVEGDDAIPENNGYYTICDGKCIREYCAEKTYRIYKIDELTRLLLNAEHPYMSLMLD